MSNAIKSALKQQNRIAEIVEKLLQLQRYQEKRMKPETVVEREVRLPPPVVVASPSPPPPRRRAQSACHDEDDEWVESSPRKLSRARPASPQAVVAATVPARVVPRPALAPAPAPPPATPPAPVVVPATPAPPAATPAEERRRAASNHSRLQMLLFKQKELLKKDIINKRFLIEKGLWVEIQKELSAELALRTRAERSKQEEVRGGKRRTAAAATTPRPSKRAAKKEKHLCICQTPYDNTKSAVRRKKSE